MIEWPHLVPVTNSQAREGLHILPAAGWCVVKRSSGSSGVIDELDKLSALQLTEWSSALKTVMGSDVEKNLTPASKSFKNAYITPARLSENQAHLLKSARSNNLTVCHGPPGTGKSFTIANMAIDHILRGESVLIVSKKDHAVDVIYDIITNLLGSGESMVRAGRKQYLRDLKNYLAKVLSTRSEEEVESDEYLTSTFKKLLDDIDRIERKLNEAINDSLNRSSIVAIPVLKWYQKLLKSFYKYRARRRPLLLEYTDLIDQKKLEKEVLVKQLISKRTEIRVDQATKEYRKDIKGLLAGLRKRKSSDQVKTFAEVDFSAVLKIFPIWLTSLSDIHRVIPFKKEMFDVVIIDEASQCDIASALPAIERAKRVVVAGDEKQLRHISFLSKNSMLKLAEDLKLSEDTQTSYDYRSVSLMDLAIENTKEGNQVATLNEHFRSVKSIISFSNQQFYNGGLRVMRERKWEEKSTSEVELYHCDGARNSAGVNTKEAEAIITKLDKLVKEGFRDPRKILSIGILSPFRSQVDELTKRVQEYAQISGYINRLTMHDVKVGTAHSFQGEERDIMLISLALSSSDNAGVRRFLEQEDVFNVSITRSKEQQVIFHSIRPTELPASSLLAKYLDSISNVEIADVYQGSESSLGDKFAENFTELCAQHGIKSSLYQSVASIAVDVLLEKNGKYLGVDLIGYPGHTRNAIGIINQQILDRVSLKLVPVGFVEWQVRSEEIIVKLLGLLK